MASLLPGMLVAILLVAVAPVSAKDYTVGDSSGWTTGVDYNAWAKGKTFNVGDTLLFQYNSVHSVAEVSAADHGACSASNPLRSYRDQSTTIALTRPGTRYFICGASGHCASGMKVAVTVSSVSGSNVTTPAPGARLAKPSNPGREAPSDTTPAGAAPAVTTTKSSSNTSGASAASGAHVASALLVGAVGLLALLMG